MSSTVEFLFCNNPSYPLSSHAPPSIPHLSPHRNMWHFERVLEGKYKGAWIHPCFLRGNKPLCSLMSRHGAPPTADEVQKMLSQNQKLRMLLPNCISLPQQHPDKVTVSHGPDNSGVRSGLPMNTWTYEPAPFFANKTEVVSSTQYHTVDTAKYICDMDDMWTPLPADSPSLDDSINSSKEDLDFLEGLQPMLSSNQPELMLEPTPLRESSVSRSIPVSHAGLTQLLEPLATMDDIF